MSAYNKPDIRNLDYPYKNNYSPTPLFGTLIQDSLLQKVLSTEEGNVIISASSANLLFSANIQKVFTLVPPMVQWRSVDTYNDIDGLYIGTEKTYVDGVGDVSGEWLQIQLPFPLQLNKFLIYGIFASFCLVGSVNGINWFLIRNIPIASVGWNTYDNITTPPCFFYRAIIPKSNNNQYVIIQELRLDGMNAINLNTNRIFNSADFRRKNTTPDIVLMNFYTSPVWNMTTSPYTYNGNVYETTASSTYLSETYNALSNQWAYNTYTVGAVQYSSWQSGNGTYSLSGNYAGAVQTSVVGYGNIAGEWLQYKFAFPFRLTYYNLKSSITSTRVKYGLPKTYYIVGSNDATTWNYVDTKTIPIDDYSQVSYEVANLSYYTYYRMIITNIVGSSFGLVAINQWLVAGQSQ